MFETYLATKRDLEAIEEGLSFVWRKELDFIFKDRTKIAKTLVISYDSKRIYLWAKKGKKYSLWKTQHNLKIKDYYHLGWRARLQPGGLNRFLPKRWQVDWFKKPKISGGLFVPFTTLQKRKNELLNPYTTYESYLATITHEFAHVYYDISTLWEYLPKRESFDYIKKAQKLYQGNEVDLKNFKLLIPKLELGYLSELFAFCSDYTAASVFWPKHKEDLDKYYAQHILKLKDQEMKQDYNIKNSVFQKDPHCFAQIMGIFLIKHYPKEWPQLILQTSK